MNTFNRFKLVSLSIFILIFALGCSSVPKTETANEMSGPKVEIKKWYSSYPEWPLVMTNYVAYGVSYPLAGMGYMVDGTLYFLGYAGIFGISCGPGLALAMAAGGGVPTNFNPCFLPVDHAVRTFEREHPQLGQRIWRATADWRHDPWDVYIENQAAAKELERSYNSPK